jgi:hypothetical protein
MLSCVIESECAHCQRPMRIELDSELNYRVVDQDAEPLVYVPMVDAAKIEGPSIIDGF